MTFGEIFKFAKKGKKIRRKEWKNEEFYLDLSKDATYFLNRFKVNTFLELEDYAADDWEIYKEREYFDFRKAFQLMEEGKHLRRKEWGDDFKGYLFIEHNTFKRVWNGSSGVFYYFNPNDYKAKDWYLVEEEE